MKGPGRAESDDDEAGPYKREHGRHSRGYLENIELPLCQDHLRYIYIYIYPCEDSPRNMMIGLYRREVEEVLWNLIEDIE